MKNVKNEKTVESAGLVVLAVLIVLFLWIRLIGSALSELEWAPRDGGRPALASELP